MADVSVGAGAPVGCICPQCKAFYRSALVCCPRDGATLVKTDTDPIIGETIGGLYVVEKLLGEGATGRVYEARHERLQRRKVAIKVMLGDVAMHPEMRLRFAQEAEAASRLSHPNVVSVLDFGANDTGLVYLVMELVRGQTLGELIQEEGRLTPARTIELTWQMCMGLAHAHGEGLVHRDFKPDNVAIEVSETGTVARILDFGLAISTEDGGSARLTTAGQFVGTPGYLAPEQWQQGDAVDHRADLYALGVAMYEMLSGKLPFSGTLQEVLWAKAESTPPTIQQITEGVVQVPPALEVIVQRLMAPNPADRYNSATEVIADLEQTGATRPRTQPGFPLKLENDTVETPDPQPVRVKRNGLALVTGFLSAVAVVGAAFFILKGETQAPVADTLPSVVTPAEQPVPPPKTVAPVAKELSLTEEAVAVAEPPPAAPTPETVEPPAPATPKAAVPTPKKVKTPPQKPAPKPRATPRKRVAKSPEPEPPKKAPSPAVPVVETTPTPVVEAAPPPKAAPSLPSATIPAPKPPLLLNAAVSIQGLSTRGSLPKREVSRALARAKGALPGCYRNAAKRANKSPPTTLEVSLVINESARASRVKVSGGALPGLAACVKDKFASARTRSAPDVGVVRVSFSVSFAPR